jgi:hypothetical protein
MDRGRTSEYFKIGSGEHQMYEQVGSTGDEPRANVVQYRDIQDPLRMGQATCFPGVAKSSAAELEEHTTSGPRLVNDINILRGLLIVAV